MKCPSCFAMKYEAGRCNKCGYDAQKLHNDIFLPIGTLLKGGEYQIGRVLGQPGGFGITYLAWDIQLEACVAIKEYLPLQIAGRGAGALAVTIHSQEQETVFENGLHSFLEEAKTLAQLRHDNIVRVHNFFRENGTAYMVMEYLEGQSLEEYLNIVGQITPPDAVALFMPVLDGLGYMHKRNLLHRDIKPSNIYLTDEGKAILLDFGAARQVIRERSQSMTAILTYGYAPWEQYHRKGKQGPWTDVYACAATLYRMISGQVPPDSAERSMEDNIIPLQNIVPKMDCTIANAIMAGLKVRFDERTQSVEEMARGLQFIPAAEQSSNNAGSAGEIKHNEPVIRFNKRVANMSAVFGPENHRLAGGLEYYELANDMGFVRSVTFSPDGTIMASGDMESTICLWSMPSGQEICKISNDMGGIRSVAFSPDGKVLASGRNDNAIDLWDVARGQELRRFFGHTGSILSVSFSPNSKVLASGAEDNTVRLWDVATGREIRQLSGHKNFVSSVAFNPDGKTMGSGSWDRTVRLWNVCNILK